MKNIRIYAVVLILCGALVGYFVYSTQKGDGIFGSLPFKLGLDLNGGSHLVYKADVSKIQANDVDSAMQTLRDVIERRVNMFGVSEPVVQVESSAFLQDEAEEKLIIELPGVTDIEEAKKRIGEAPLLEFKLVDEKIYKELQDIESASTTNIQVASVKKQELLQKLYIDTGLTGALLKRATLQFNPTTSAPEVALEFNSEGRDLFAKITKENLGKVLAIFLDGQPMVLPVIQSEIRDGLAQITGNFEIKEAKDIVRNLNYGALPVPIELISTQTIGASLGDKAVSAGISSSIWAFLVIALFLILWYRLPGFVAVVALVVYIFINLAIFKIIPVTLTAAGIAGFILSMGMAVDANILIFERTKEELKSGKSPEEAIKEGFKRAWLSIRDSNVSSLITAAILYSFPSTTVIEGFALVFGIGVAVSMFSAITLSRTLLLAIGFKRDTKLSRFVLSSGIK